MRYLLLILLLPLVTVAQTVELSALNYGTHNGMTAAQRDAKFIADVKAPMDNHGKSGSTTGAFIYHYTYTINDSAYSLLYAPDRDITVIERYFNFSDGKAIECPVELKWATVSKESPAKVSIAKYDTWKGGPRQLKIKEIKPNDSNVCAVGIVKKAAVDEAMKDGKEWTEKASGKKLTAAEKRKAAWAVETGKKSQAEYIIKATAVGK